MIVKVRTAALIGVNSIPVMAEVRASNGGTSPRFSIIGLADNAIKESRDRVASAILNSGFQLPDQILVNLAPAEVKKEGAAYDLPIAIGILVASRQLPAEAIAPRSFHGELSLDGRVKPIRGTISFCVDAGRSHLQEIIVPPENLAEARLIPEVGSRAFHYLNEIVHYLRSGEPDGEVVPKSSAAIEPVVRRGFNDIVGQSVAKRALVIAAAGGHNLLMFGPPGCGKSMLAERFPGILPPLARREVLEVLTVYSAAGLPVDPFLRGERPYRTPHYVISDAGLVGGGVLPRPGEISLSHNGVLFLDELPEFRRSAIEALRLPLETGNITVSRARAQSSFPARFQLVAAMNPCPCGRLGASNVEGERCTCSPGAIDGYLRKLSQPILDRIDLHVELSAVPIRSIVNLTAPSPHASDDLEQLQTTVARARELQCDRNGGVLNAQLDGERLKRGTALNTDSVSLLERAGEKLKLSARGVIRVVRVARTIADLAGESDIATAHVAEALSFRSLERLRQFAGGGSETSRWQR